MQSSNIDEFKLNNSPLEEVVLGVIFPSNLPITYPHVGLFWNTIKEDFSSCEHVSTLASNPSFIPRDERTGLPSTRFWLIHKDNGRLIQIQNNIFYYNWRNKGSKYPGYEALYPEFIKYFEQYKEFLINNALVDKDYFDQIKVGFDITYVNHISKNSGWDVIQSSTNILEGIDFINRNSKNTKLQGFSNAVAYDLDNDSGTLTIKNAYGRIEEKNQEIIYLELSIKETSPKFELKAIESWFNGSHKTIIENFKNFTTDNARVIWEEIK